MINSTASNIEYSANYIWGTIPGEARKKLFLELHEAFKRAKMQELRKKFDKVSQV